jgi:hypothetical protein
MVDTALWADANLPAGSLVAAHDIGALGYFSRVAILDLAGLISPEVIPFITDDARLINYLDAHNVQFLIAFSHWHPVLIARGEALHVIESQFQPGTDLGSMSVYRWRQP